MSDTRQTARKMACAPAKAGETNWVEAPIYWITGPIWPAGHRASGWACERGAARTEG
jgi:hypothetical protein